MIYTDPHLVRTLQVILEFLGTFAFAISGIRLYAVASVGGGLIYWALFSLGLPLPITVIVTFLAICLIRFIAVGYHISLPTLHDEDEKK